MNSRFRIQLSAPLYSSEIEDAVLSVIRSGWWIAGRRVGEFETQLQDITGRKHAIAISSGTGALLAAMVAMGIGPGSTVVVPAFTFPAPADAAAFLGAEIRLCDVDPYTFNISRETLLAVLDDSVSCVVGIDQFGSPCPAVALESVCRDLGIPLLIDAACALGATLMNRPCGAFGDAAIFSFHPRKIISTGEGGAVVTDDDELASAVRQFRNIGLDDGRFKRIGLNLRPSEIGAAMGSVQLNRLDEIISYRRKLAKMYADLPFALQQPLEDASVNYQSLIAVLSRSGGSADRPEEHNRDDLVRFLATKGIEAQVGSYYLPGIEWLAERMGATAALLPVSAMLHNNTVALPLHWRMTENDVKDVVNCCNEWWQQIGGRT